MSPLTPTEADEFRIRRLSEAYSHAVMLLDGPAAAAVYAPDGVLAAFYGPDIVGREAIATALSRGFEKFEFVMQACNAGVVQVEGAMARARWSVTEWMRRKGAAGELEFCLGAYEDRLIRTDEGWRFTHRRYMPIYRGTTPAKAKGWPNPEFDPMFSLSSVIGSPGR